MAPPPVSLPKGWAGCEQGAAWGSDLGSGECTLPPSTGTEALPPGQGEERPREPRMFLVGRSDLGRQCLPCWGNEGNVGVELSGPSPPPSTTEAPAGRGQALRLSELWLSRLGMEATPPPPRASRVEVVHDRLLSPLPCSRPGLVSLEEGTGHELSPVLPGVPTPHGPHGEPRREEGAHTPLRIGGPVCARMPRPGRCCGACRRAGPCSGPGRCGLRGRVRLCPKKQMQVDHDV